MPSSVRDEALSLDPLSPVNPKAVAATRDQKPPLDLLEPAADELTALALKTGADKYGRQNYLTIPIKYRVYLGAIQRHLNALKRGEDLDPESGIHHLGHIGANVHVLSSVLGNGNLEDDRGPAERTPEQEARSSASNDYHYTGDAADLAVDDSDGDDFFIEKLVTLTRAHEESRLVTVTWGDPERVDTGHVHRILKTERDGAAPYVVLGSGGALVNAPYAAIKKVAVR